MRSHVSDGDAVGACRALLLERQVRGTEGWRSTVVRHQDAPGRVVRVWIDTPAHERRPVGAADYVFDALLDSTVADGLRIHQLHPAGEWSASHASRS